MSKLISRAFLAAALLAPVAAPLKALPPGVASRLSRHPAPVRPAHGKTSGFQLAAVDAAALRHRLAALKGKVVVLNVWATWCGPCVKEFPELVRFDRAYRSRGVTVIGLSTDDPGKARQLVPPFLARQQVSFPIYIMKPVDPQKVIAVVDKGWEGFIPMTYFIDRSGRLRTRFESARTYEAFADAVKPLLKG